MESVILNYAPSYWNKDYTGVSHQFKIKEYTDEYRQIFFEVCRATGTKSLNNIQRNQSIYDLGQMLVREQLKINLANGLTDLYRVRRFIKIKKQYLPAALQHNLDYRRCGLSALEFKRQLRDIRPDDVLIAVQVVTNTPNADVIVPENSSNYFIDYIINWA